MIYGAGGGIGSAVARAFAREGAKLFLTGHKLAPVEVVGKAIVSAGGSAEATEVDALDEQAVDKHLQSVIDKAGRVDISFNAVGIPNATILGVPLIELDLEQFSLPITTYAVVQATAPRPSGAGGSWAASPDSSHVARAWTRAMNAPMSRAPPTKKPV